MPVIVVTRLRLKDPAGVNRALAGHSPCCKFDCWLDDRFSFGTHVPVFTPL